MGVNPEIFENYSIASTSALSAASSSTLKIEPQVEQENLFEAVQELGTALRKERAYAGKLSEELENLRAQRQSEIRAQRLKLREASEQENTAQAALAQARADRKALENQVASLQNHLRSLQTELRQSTLRETEEKDKIRFEQELQRTSQTYHHQKHKQLQIENEELKGHLAPLREENKRLSDALQKTQDHAAAESRSSEVNQLSLLKKIAELNTELAQYRAEWSQQVQMQTRLRAAAHQLQEISQAHRSLSEQHQRLKQQMTGSSSETNQFKQRISDLEQQIDNERSEKHMVLASLRTSEIKLSRLESRNSELELDLERLRERPTVQKPQLDCGTGARFAKTFDEVEDFSPEISAGAKFFTAYADQKGEA